MLYGADYCGRAADVWAAGVSLYILLTAGFPFTRPKDEGEEPQRGLQAMFLRIVTGRYAPATGMQATRMGKINLRCPRCCGMSMLLWHVYAALARSAAVAHLIDLPAASQFLP